jgi:hypothetical protein
MYVCMYVCDGTLHMYGGALHVHRHALGLNVG